MNKFEAWAITIALAGVILAMPARAIWRLAFAAAVFSIIAAVL